MSFEELNVPKNHIYLFKPQAEKILTTPLAIAPVGLHILV